MGKSPKDRGRQKHAMLEGLEDLRKQLDEVDHEILAALTRRDRLVMEVAQRKAKRGDGRVRDLAREEALLSRLSGEGQRAGLDGYYVTRVFREVVDHSVRLQQEHLTRISNPERAAAGEWVIAYQGVDGAYSHLAAMRHFGPRGGAVAFRGYPSFRSMMEAVRDGHARYGILPIENTTAGSINDAYDLLAQMDLSIVGEEVQKVEHCLVALEDIPLSRIRRVFSHPQALAQCANFLSTLAECHVEAFNDTAGAVQRISLEQDLSQAAIASEEAARRYGLVVVKRDIANQKENFTRMVIVANKPEKVDARVAAKTSLIFATKHEEGALLACLNALAQRHLNLTKLESRPRPRTPWEYLFYVDFEGNLAEETVVDALRDLSAQTSYLRVLGSYPARTTREAKAAEVRPVASRADKPQAVRAELEQLPNRLTSRRHMPEDSVYDVAGVRLGATDPVLIARVERYGTRVELSERARALRAAGAHMLWVGCFDVETRERASEMGVDPLLLLAEVGASQGLPMVTEVFHPAEVERAVQHAQVLVVGAAQMQNSALLHEVGRIDRPVIVERGPIASLEEWLLAAEYVFQRGNQRVVLCERGVRTFDKTLPSSLDLAGVALLRERSHLPVLVDPCRATGSGSLALRLSESACHAGAQGLVLSVAGPGQPPAAMAISVDDLSGLGARLRGG